MTLCTPQQLSCSPLSLGGDSLVSSRPLSETSCVQVPTLNLGTAGLNVCEYIGSFPGALKLLVLSCEFRRFKKNRLDHLLCMPAPWTSNRTPSYGSSELSPHVAWLASRQPEQLKSLPIKMLRHWSSGA